MGASQQALLVAGAPLPTYSYWNPSDKAAAITLSGANNQIASGNGTTAAKGVRSVVGKNSGKHRVQLVLTTFASTTGFGVSVAGHSLTVYLGGQTNGAGFWGNYGGSGADGHVYANAAPQVVHAGKNMNTGMVLDALIDIPAGKIWWKRNDVIVSGDPEAGTGAMATFTAGSTVFLHADIFGPSGTVTLRTNPSEMTGTPIAGFNDGWSD